MTALLFLLAFITTAFTIGYYMIIDASIQSEPHFDVAVLYIGSTLAVLTWYALYCNVTPT